MGVIDDGNKSPIEKLEELNQRVKELEKNSSPVFAPYNNLWLGWSPADFRVKIQNLEQQLAAKTKENGEMLEALVNIQSIIGKILGEAV